MADSQDSAAGRSEQEIYDVRLRKADALRQLGVNPFGSGHKVHDAIGHVVSSFGGFDGPGLEALPQKPRAAIAGRIVAERSFGKAGFLKLRDRTGEVQVYVKKDVLGEAAYEVVKLAEVGDDRGGQAANHHPDHAAHREVQEGTDERRQVAGAAEFPDVHRVAHSSGSGTQSRGGHDGLHSGPRSFGGL